MVWFVCDDCGDTLKKPKLINHFRSCRAGRLTCLDCSRSFDRQGAQAHVACVTEHEKYALCATKPGGFAANDFGGGSAGGRQVATTQPAAQAGGPVGVEFLSTRPPWRCSICNVACTSAETLAGHAAGMKHVRRAKAAAAAAVAAAAPVVAAAVAAVSTAAAAEPVEVVSCAVVAEAAADVGSGATTSGAEAADAQPAKISKKALRKLLKGLKVPDASHLQPLYAAVRVKLKKKGKVGSKLLQKVAIKSLGTEEALPADLLQALKSQLVADGVCSMESDQSYLLPCS